jgi:ketol-acid reductoisomerase
MKTIEKTVKKEKAKGGRPIKTIKKDSGIRVRLSKTERYLIAEKAKKAGLKMSDWVRQAAKTEKVNSRFSADEMSMMRTLTGMANNLNQLTKLAHQHGLLVIHQKCRNLLSLIDDTLKYFVRDDRQDN